MDILNKKERTKSFLLFLLMLVIAFGTLSAGLFFNQKLPWKENKILRVENQQIRYELNYQVRFIQELKKIDKSIDSLSKINEGYFFVEKTITSDIIELRNRIPKDSLENYQLYDNMVLNYKKLLDAKSSLKKIEGQQNEVDKFNETIQDCEKEVQDLERALELCKRLSRS